MATNYDNIYGTDRDYNTGLVITGTDVLAQQVVKRLFSTMYWDSRSLNLDDYLMQKIDFAGAKFLESSIVNLFDNDPRFSLSAKVDLKNRGVFITMVISPTTDDTPIIVTYDQATNNLKIERQS